MKRHLSYIVITLLVTACGNFRDDGRYNTFSRNNRTRMCTMEYQPTICSADRYTNGVLLSEPVEVAGSNRCDAGYKFEDEAIAMGINPSLLAMQCANDPDPEF